MIRIRQPSHLAWTAGRFWTVPHGLGTGVAIFRIEIPADVSVPQQLVGSREYERANRIRDPAERSFLLGSHAVLRCVLADALGKSPTEIGCGCDESGKPRLADGGLRFNMSRSGAATLIGVSTDAEIGVDIEAIKEMPDAAIVAREHLSSREHAAWLGLDADSATPALLQCWVRKEACLKVSGIGLAGRPGELDVGWSPDPSPMQVSLTHGSTAWPMRVVSLPMPPEVVAAAAVVKASGQVVTTLQD